MCQLFFSCFRSSAQLGRMMEQLSSLEVVTSRSKCGLCCQVVSLRRLRCMMRLSRRSHGFLRWIFLSLEAGIRLWGVHAQSIALNLHLLHLEVEYILSIDVLLCCYQWLLIIIACSLKGLVCCLRLLTCFWQLRTNIDYIKYCKRFMYSILFIFPF